MDDEQAYLWSSAMWGADPLPVSVLTDARERLRANHGRDVAVYAVPPPELIAGGPISPARFRAAVTGALRAMGAGDDDIRDVEEGFGIAGMPYDYRSGLDKAYEKLQDLIAFGPGGGVPPRIDASHAETFCLAIRAVLFAFRGRGDLLYLNMAQAISELEQLAAEFS
ncbi:hypothetical protein EPN52_07155 [bacterium]|nr:MAG: hypothetical protein EPN52_07155 [bacterium]